MAARSSRRTRQGQLHGLTAYDASYLMLAIAGGAALATADAELAATAERIGVPIAPW
jgi:predicted nucleic acid-binding protein